MFYNKYHINHLHLTKIKCVGTNIITSISISLEWNDPEQISSQSFPSHRIKMFRSKSHHNQVHLRRIECSGTMLIKCFGTNLSIFISQESNVLEQISYQSFTSHENQMCRNKSHNNLFHITRIKWSGANLISSSPCKKNRMLRNNANWMFRKNSQHVHITDIKCSGTVSHSEQTLRKHYHITGIKSRNKSHHNHVHITELKCSGANLITIKSI